MTGSSFNNLSYLSRCSLLQSWRFRRIRSKVIRSIESDLICTKLLGANSRYNLRSGSLRHPLSSSMFKNKRIFSLVISKLMPVFSLWLYNLVYPTIISTNASSRNNLRSLRGFTISSTLLNCGIFVLSITLISRFSHFTSKTGNFGNLR